MRHRLTLPMLPFQHFETNCEELVILARRTERRGRGCSLAVDQ